MEYLLLAVAFVGLVLVDYDTKDIEDVIEEVREVKTILKNRKNV